MFADEFPPAYDVSDAVGTERGSVVLAKRPGDSLALGLVGTFWRPVMTCAAVEREQSREFAEPGFATAVDELSVRELDDRRTLLTGVMRTATTDERARRWLGRHWPLGVGSGAHVPVNGLLEQTSDGAERLRAA